MTTLLRFAELVTMAPVLRASAQWEARLAFIDTLGSRATAHRLLDWLKNSERSPVGELFSLIHRTQAERRRRTSV